MNALKLYTKRKIFKVLKGNGHSHFDVIPTAAPAHVGKALNISIGQIIDDEFEYWRPDAVIINIESIERK